MGSTTQTDLLPVHTIRVQPGWVGWLQGLVCLACVAAEDVAY
jgi:hypothetical protein